MEKEAENTLPRRTIVKSAAWSIPVIAAAAAVPGAAASDNIPTCDPLDYMAAVSSNFNPRPSGYYRDFQGPHWVSTASAWEFMGKVVYNGKFDLPAGSRIALFLGNNSRSMSNPHYSIVSGAEYLGTPVRTPTSSSTVGSYTWTFTTVAPMPPGTVVEISYGMTSAAQGTLNSFNGGGYTITWFTPNVCGTASSANTVGAQLAARPRSVPGLNARAEGGYWFARLASY